MHVLAGLSRRVIVKDAETGRTQTYSVGSDVLAQQFALRVSQSDYIKVIKACLSSLEICLCRFLLDMTKNNTTQKENTRQIKRPPFFPQVPVLFNGCRSGEIFSIDLRQRGRRDQSWKASRFHQESAITSVRVLQDENYLLAADMLGQVRF